VPPHEGRGEELQKKHGKEKRKREELSKKANNRPEGKRARTSSQLVKGESPQTRFVKRLRKHRIRHQRGEGGERGGVMGAMPVDKRSRARLGDPGRGLRPEPAGTLAQGKRTPSILPSGWAWTEKIPPERGFTKTDTAIVKGGNGVYAGNQCRLIDKSRQEPGPQLRGDYGENGPASLSTVAPGGRPRGKYPQKKKTLTEIVKGSSKKSSVRR